jgi:hypothetical protein
MNHDAIWHNPLTNETAWSQMNGSTIIDSQRLFNRPSTTWKLSATGDFNRDGELDVLWRDQTSGAMQWWLLGHDRQINGVQSINPNPDQTWQIAGVGDFNQDGQLDIFWRHQSGLNQVWIMPFTDPSQSFVAPVTGLALPSVPPGWNVGTIGDMNQDGAPDILWIGPEGHAQWWQMAQRQIIAVNPIDPSFGGKQVTGSADFNGDGTLDLIVKDVTVGTSDLWLMSKPAIGGTISTISRSVIQPDSRFGQTVGWQIAGVAKMDAGNSLVDATFEPNNVFRRSQSIGGLNDPSDFYRFNLSGSGLFAANLTGLTADADLRLIADRDNDGKINLGDGSIGSSEILAWPGERGTTPESLEVFLKPGSYFLEVRSHNNQLTNYQLTTNFTAQAQAPTPKLKLQISFDATSEAQLDPATKTAIYAAKDFWEAQLSGGGSLVPGGILPIKITTEALKLKTGLPDNVTLAYSGPTIGSNDGKTLQIQSATTTINRLRLGTVNATGLKDLFIHEFSHNLGFGTLWEPLSFRNADGSIRQIGGLTADGSKLIDRTTNRYAANSNAGWAYGQLLRDAGATSIVPTAVPIEAGVAAHWDESVFQTESLTPVANSESQPISLLTLAALKDLGWKVNFGAAAPSYQLPTTASAPSGIDFANLNRPPSASSLSA